MEKYFDIRYEFDRPTVHKCIEEQVAKGDAGYICVADGNILNMVHHNAEYRSVINSSMFSICDSSWVPTFVKWIYGYRRHHYCGSDIFQDIVAGKKYRMLFLGAKQRVLNALQQNLKSMNPAVEDMKFIELPFCKVEDFDYPAIAEIVNKDGADIVWVSLGAPKQEMFMNRLLPHLDRGVMIAVGAAFNFFSGLADAPRRCPEWMYKCHLEFVHRIFKEPKKQIKRCWGIVVTLPRILGKESRRKRRNKKNKQ